MKLHIPLIGMVALLASGPDRISGASVDLPQPADRSYRAYWLTAKVERSPGYRHLLITRGCIGDLAGHRSWSALPLDNVAMTFRTYGTDSLWNKPFQSVERFGDIDAKAKTADIDGIAYLYEPCPLQDVLRLLENPMGTMSIHRAEHPLAGAGQTAKAFCLLLREQMQAQPHGNPSPKVR